MGWVFVWILRKEIDGGGGCVCFGGSEEGKGEGRVSSLHPRQGPGLGGGVSFSEFSNGLGG